MPDQSLKIQGARFVITVDAQRRIIQDGTVLVEGQRITRVGKAADLAEVAADQIIDASEMVVTPGFINGHLHISYAHAVRGIFPDDLGPAYLPNVFRLQQAMSEDDEYYTSLLAITELLKYGTTTFLDPGSTRYLDRCAQAYQESGCRVITGTHVADRPNPLNLPVSTTADAIRTMEQTIVEHHNTQHGRIRAWAMPFAPEYCSTELLVAARGLTDQHQTGMTTHHNYSPQALKRWLRQHRRRPAQHLDDLGVLGPNLLLAHGLGIDEAELECIARAGTRIVVCPTAAIKGAAGMTRTGMLPEMLTKGIPVGLGTDAGNNSNLLETLRSMYLVAVLYKDGRRDWNMIPAETALELATIGGAAALGLEQDLGSIEIGKKADLVLFDTRRPEWRALFNPVNSLVYNADGRSVHSVVIDGRVVVKAHQPLFVDEGELIQRVQALGEDLVARTGVSYPSRWPVI
jgi:cytosine/adenosine deaminase-related metal-dependent hydrolase